jgi:hypothetical protein
MARSPLIDTDFTPTEPAGRDSASLGPSDTSDSGSDVTGIAPDDGTASDSGGTGERRGAAGDADIAEAADIGVDRVFEPDLPHDQAGPPAADTTQSPESIGPSVKSSQQRARRRGAQHGGRSLSGKPRRR